VPDGASILRYQSETGMNGYLFTTNTTRMQLRVTTARYGQAERVQTWNSCDSLILCADTSEAAQKRFEEWLSTCPEGENPVEVRINRIVAAQFFEQQLTETGPVPIDWPEIAKQARSDVESTPVDDFEQGYWVDVNAVLRPAPDLDTLRLELPEDISSGLNWSPEKQFFFLLSVLGPPSPPPAESATEPEAGDAPDSSESSEENPGEFPISQVEQSQDFPEMADKEAAVLIRARNSVVAAWLWRKFSVDTPLLANQIRIDPLCGFAAPKDADEEPAQ
jgi:hypothetical protein